MTLCDPFSLTKGYSLHFRKKFGSEKVLCKRKGSPFWIFSIEIFSKKMFSQKLFIPSGIFQHIFYKNFHNSVTSYKKTYIFPNIERGANLVHSQCVLMLISLEKLIYFGLVYMEPLFDTSFYFLYVGRSRLVLIGTKSETFDGEIRKFVPFERCNFAVLFF